MLYRPIIGTLGFVLSPDERTTLLVHRIGRADDQSYGRWNGLGGKLHADEDVASGMRRELREEAAIDVDAMELRGTISWPGFGPNGEDWLGFVFLIRSFTGEAASGNEEGPLAWVPVSELLAGSLPMWEGDRYFLPLVFDGDPRPFHGVMPYSGGLPTSWAWSR